MESPHPDNRDPATPGLATPVPAAVQARLRRAVLDHGRAERRRVHPAVVHVGSPGGAEYTFEVRPGKADDHGLRTDVVAALLARARRTEEAPLVWLTRPGPLHVQDVDAEWLAAAWAAYAEAGVPMTMVVANRHGWRDPRSGVGRVWTRLRGS